MLCVGRGADTGETCLRLVLNAGGAKPPPLAARIIVWWYILSVILCEEILRSSFCRVSYRQSTISAIF